MKTANTSGKIKGIKRIIKAASYSAAGLKSAVKNEPAFREELIISALTLPLLPFLSAPCYLKWLIFFAHLLIMITELLNSAIEAVVDLASPEYNRLAGRAKDLGSAAVFLGLVLAGILWAYALLLVFL